MFVRLQKVRYDMPGVASSIACNLRENEENKHVHFELDSQATIYWRVCIGNAGRDCRIDAPLSVESVKESHIQVKVPGTPMLSKAGSTEH